MALTRIKTDQITNGAILGEDLSATVDLTSKTLTNFRSTGIDDNATALAVTINADGQVGIGTDTPQAALHIKRQDTVQNLEKHTDFIIENPGAGNARFFLKTSTNNRNWEFFADDTDGAFGIFDGVAAARRFTIMPDGNIGIGINIPTARLNVVANTTYDAVRITQTGTGNALVVEDSANPDSTPFVITADGKVSVGAPVPQAGPAFAVYRPMTGDPYSSTILAASTIQADVTSRAASFLSAPGIPASVTIPSVSHYFVDKAYLGSGSAVTYQNGFVVDPSMNNASYNYAYVGGLPITSGKECWNLYLYGTAPNYINGSVGIGTTSMTGKLTVNGDVVSLSQNPSFAWLGDINGAKWLSKLGDYSLSFMSDGATAGYESQTSYGRTFYSVVRFHPSNGLQTYGNTHLATNTGAVGIGTTSPIAKLQVEEMGLDTTTTPIIDNAEQTIFSIATTAFRTAEFMIQVTDNTNSQYHAAKVFLMHNGTDVWFNVTNVLHSAAELGTFGANIFSGNVRLTFTAAAATTKTVKVGATMIAV